MFGKFFKHELSNSYKFPLISFIICALACAVGSLTIKIDVDFLSILSIFLIAGAFTFGGIALIITLVKQFKDNLFNQQGYLTLTLPVKTSTIILAKVLVSFIYGLAYLLLIVLLLVIFASSVNIRGELFSAIFELLKLLYSGDGIWAGIIPVFTTIFSFAAWLFLLLSIGAITHTGATRKRAGLITVGIIFLYLVILSYLSSSESLPQLLYSIETKKYYWMSVKEFVNYALTLSEQEAYTLASGLRSVFNPFVVLFHLFVIFGGYFLSKYLIQNKLDLA